MDETETEIHIPRWFGWFEGDQWVEGDDYQFLDYVQNEAFNIATMPEGEAELDKFVTALLPDGEASRRKAFALKNALSWVHSRACYPNRTKCY